MKGHLGCVDYSVAAYERIIASGEAALARWSASNPMRGMIERQVADARGALAKAGAA